jgi:hypothetical protein
MRLRICPPDTISICVALHAGWISTLDIVARHAVLDVAPCNFRMAAAATAHSDPREIRTHVPGRLERSLRHVSACGVALHAKILSGMACEAFRRFRLGVNAMGEPIVQGVRHLQLELVW